MLVLFPEIKKKEVFLLFFNFTKRFQTTEKDFASMFQPSLFLRFIVVFFLFVFPSRHYPTHPQGKESSQSVNFLMPQEPTFSREESKWVTSLFWPRYKCYPRLPPPPQSYFQNWMTNSILWGPDCIPLRSRLVLKSSGLFLFPPKASFYPSLHPSSLFLHPPSIELCCEGSGHTQRILQE